MDDDWKKEYSTSDERHAKMEFGWFRNHVSAREYILICRTVREDGFDDPMPF